MGTLYVGSTSDLIKRGQEHKIMWFPAALQHNIMYMLVYCQVVVPIYEAARLETRFKIEIVENGNSI